MKYLLEVTWSDADADWYYSLKVSSHPRRDHSCYSCCDDWAFRRRKCHNNRNDWTQVPNAYGDEKWAKKIAKHYGITMPAKERKDNGK